MASLFDKATTFLASVAHRNLDRAIKKNAPEYMKQLVRDVESAESEAAAATASAKGGLVAARQKADKIKAHIEELKLGAAQLLDDTDPTNDHFADDIMAQVMEEEKALANQNQIVSAGEVTVKSIETVWHNLSAKRKDLVGKVQELQALDESTKAKEAGASAVKAANEAIGGIDGKSIDDLEGDMRKRAATADATLEQTMETSKNDPMQAVRDSQVAGRVAALRAELAAKKNGATPAAAKGQTGGAPTTGATSNT